MEFREYLKILQQEKSIIINTVIILMFFTTVFTLLRPVSYASDLVLLISRKGTQATDNYKYDGYYAVQASDILAIISADGLQARRSPAKFIRKRA